MQDESSLLRPPSFNLSPEDETFFSFMSGFAPLSPETCLEAPLGTHDDDIRAASRTSFALELVYDRTLTRPPPGFENQPTMEQAKHICPDMKTYGMGLKHLVGHCDRIFRSSVAPCAGLAADGQFAKRSNFFEQACMCYRPAAGTSVASFDVDLDGSLEDIDFESSFKTFTEAACGRFVPHDAYGSAGDIVKLEHDILDSLKQAALQTQRLVNMMRGSQLVGSMHSHPGPFESYDEILRKVDHCIEISHPDTWDFANLLDARQMSLGNAHDLFDVLQSRVYDHVAKRRDENHAHLLHMGDDVFARMAQHLDTTSAVALMATCLEYSGLATDPESVASHLKARVPHMHVRFIVGNFPHHRAASRDREALLNNESKPVLRDFVLARQAVRLHVDFVRATLRPTPLKKKDRPDGLSNIHHDFSDDEYEEPPESLGRRGPQVLSPPNLDTEWGRGQADAQRRARAVWLAAEGPEEPMDRFVYNKRISYDTYFSAPLQITPCLVYADSKEPVVADFTAGKMGGLELSKQMLRDAGRFSQPPKYGARDHMPASCKFHIPHLTYDHAGRLFCLRLTGTATLAKSGSLFTQTIYTQPFEVVSKLDVIKKAARRRTAQEISAEASKRAKSKAAKKQQVARPP